MTYKDVSGNLDWITENMDTDVELTDEQIGEWIAEITEMVIEQQTIQIEAEAETKQYPVQMWTSDVIAATADEYIALKLEALHEELKQERPGLFQYLRAQVNPQHDDDDIVVLTKVSYEGWDAPGYNWVVGVPGAGDYRILYAAFSPGLNGRMGVTNYSPSAPQSWAIVRWYDDDDDDDWENWED